MYFVPN